ncbi:uncharacterized protein [Henckelia pumila]|uniref:uncharacterized protein n=1 Tax=Henckelia pumila TaxID=405737 RepID=UPI003C6E929C
MRPIQVCAIQAEPELLIRIKDTQKEDQGIQKLFEMVMSGHQSEYKVSTDDILYVNNRLVVPNVSDLKQQILKEAHCSGYNIHPGGRKIYSDLKNHYWWKQMKSDVAEYVSKRMNFQQVKAERKNPGGLLQIVSGIHDVFHVLMLRKYQPDLSHIIQVDEAELDETLSYFEKPIQILDRKEKQLQTKTIPLMKIQWSRHGVEEATWETEDDIRQKFPYLFH